MQGNGFFFREFKCHLSSISRNEQENMEECNFWKSLSMGQDLLAFKQRICITHKNRTWEVPAASVNSMMFDFSQFLTSSL